MLLGGRARRSRGPRESSEQRSTERSNRHRREVFKLGAYPPSCSSRTLPPNGSLVPLRQRPPQTRAGQRRSRTLRLLVHIRPTCIPHSTHTPSPAPALIPPRLAHASRLVRNNRIPPCTLYKRHSSTRNEIIRIRAPVRQDTPWIGSHNPCSKNNCSQMGRVTVLLQILCWVRWGRVHSLR